MTKTIEVAFIKARWHADIVDQALVGFEEDMAKSNQTVNITALDVPGAFEMPLSRGTVQLPGVMQHAERAAPARKAK